MPRQNNPDDPHGSVPDERIWKVRERVTMERIVYVRAATPGEAKEKARDSDTVDETDPAPIGPYTYPGKATPAPNHTGRRPDAF